MNKMIQKLFLNLSVSKKNGAIVGLISIIALIGLMIF